MCGLTCFAVAIYAFLSRSTGPCGKPESCPVAGAVHSHPYTGYGYLLVCIGLIAFGASVILAARRPSAG
jgi:hypothetical protein